MKKKDTENTIKVSLLVEHKSYPDKYTPIQIGGYIFSGLQKQIDNKEKLSLIIPILFYHGKEKWEYQTLENLFENLEPEWKQFIPNFNYIYNDLRKISDKQVEALNNKFLAASILALKHSFQKDWLENNAHRILILIKDAPENLQKNFVVYLFERSKFTEQRIIELLDTLPPTLKEAVMSTSDFFIEKGVAIGMTKKEYEKNYVFTKSLILETSFEDARIAQLVGVTLDFVVGIRAEINPSK